MAFKLSQRSLSRLEGVDDALVAVVQRAIEVTTIDFDSFRTWRTTGNYTSCWSR